MTTEDEALGHGASGAARGTLPSRRFSGKRVALGFGALLLAVVAAALMAFLSTRTPDGPILALVAVDDQQAVVLRADPRRGHPYLSVESSAGTERSLALFGAPPGARPRVGDGIVTVPVTGARGVHEVNAFRLETFEFLYRAGQPEPESSPPTPSSRLPLTLGDGSIEVALYGEPLDQAVAFGRADGTPVFRARLVPVADAPAQAWPTSRGLLFFNGQGVVRAYDRRHDSSARPPRDPQPVGGPGASFCALGEGWLFLTRAGSLHRLLPTGASERVAQDLPTSGSLLACGTRASSLVLFMGDVPQGGVTRVIRLDGEGQLAWDVSLAPGSSAGPRLAIAGDLPQFVAVSDGAGAARVVDLDAGRAERTAACAGARILVTPEGSYTAVDDVIARTDGSTGELEAWSLPGVRAGQVPRSDQLSLGRLFVPAGTGFAVFDRSDFSLVGVRSVPAPTPRDGC